MFSKSTDNKTFMVCGFVARDAEYRTVGEKNSSLTKFSVKCDEKQEADGTTTAIWTNCECWNAVARYAAGIKKGDTVLAIGTIKVDTYTDKKTGEQKQSKNLVCEFVSIIPGSQAAKQTQTAPSGYPAQPTANTKVETSATDDDYPF